MYGWNGCRVGPKRTESTSVLLRVRLNLRRRWHWCWIQYEAVVSRCPNTLQWRWRLCIDLSLFIEYGWNGCCCGPGRAACTFALLCVRLKLKLVFDAVWGHNLTCSNILQWQWWLWVNLCCYMYGTAVALLALNEQGVRLHCCVDMVCAWIWWYCWLVSNAV